jgi:Mg2+-importing ATPase
MSSVDAQELLSGQVSIGRAGRSAAREVLGSLDPGPAGLSVAEAARRRTVFGPNAVRTHRASAWAVLGRQLGSPILILVIITAGVSLFLAEATNAVVIGVILLVSVGLGFGNEFRAERAAEALHSRVAHRVIAIREGVASDPKATDRTKA